MHLCLCIHCSEKFQDRDQLFEHMKTEDHLQPPKDSSEWDQPQVFIWKKIDFIETCLPSENMIASVFIRDPKVFRGKDITNFGSRDIW